MRLQGKTIFLTGAAGLLGSAYTKLFLEQGAFVIATDKSSPNATALQNRHHQNEHFSFIELDVTDEKAIEDTFADIRAKDVQPNVFINNAAITSELLVREHGSFPELRDLRREDWEAALEVNLTGAFLIARQIDRDIAGRWPFRLINISTMYAFRAPHHKIYADMPFKAFCAYSASKAGIHGLTLWLASYWADKEGNVNTLAPGPVFNQHSPEFKSRVSALTMLDRMALPEEMAGPMSFLCSEDANYVTGQILNVDGGFSGW